MKNVFVTNGYMTADAIRMISPYLDAANVDLKFFSDESYKKICGGRLQPVLDSIKTMKDEGIWVEVTTLIIPGKNDSDEELKKIAAFLAGIDEEMPWHISRFFPQYKYDDVLPTPIERINTAVQIGKEEGLKYIYPGNVSGEVDTMCPSCKKNIIRRSIFTVEEKNIENGKCGYCGAVIKGVWK
jgi:pyruvate formate lyase activating enzyme